MCYIYTMKYYSAVKNKGCRAVVAHFGGRGRQISEFEDSLVYRVSSRTARTTQRNPVSKKQKKAQRDQGYKVHI